MDMEADTIFRTWIARWHEKVDHGRETAKSLPSTQNSLYGADRISVRIHAALNLSTSARGEMYDLNSQNDGRRSNNNIIITKA